MKNIRFKGRFNSSKGVVYVALAEFQRRNILATSKDVSEVTGLRLDVVCQILRRGYEKDNPDVARNIKAGAKRAVYWYWLDRRGRDWVNSIGETKRQEFLTRMYEVARETGPNRLFRPMQNNIPNKAVTANA